MNMIKKYILLLVIALFIAGVFNRPAMSDERLPDNFIYLFHLYYDNGQLLADRDFEFKYDLVAGEYVQESFNTSNPFKGELIDVNGKVRATFEFDPKSGNQTFTKGKISVKGPYFADASEVNFYDDRGQLLLKIGVGGSSFCDNNGVCNKDVGENSDNCPADCKPEPTVTPAPADGVGLSRNIIFGTVGAVAAVVIWVVWLIIKKRRSRIASNQMPPTVPPAMV